MSIMRNYPLTTAQIKYAERLSYKERHQLEAHGAFDLQFADPWFLPYGGKFRTKA